MANLTGVWGSSATDVYVSVNSNFIMHSAGDGTWQHQDYTAGTVFNDIWGSGPADIDAWRSLRGYWGTAPDNLYLATGTGIFHGTP